VATGTIGFFLAGSVLGLAFGIIYAYSLCHVLERSAKGLYAGLFESSIGIGQIAGPLSMGYIAFVISPAAPYFTMGILGLASALAIALAMVKGSKEEP
jgi:MFS family permease